MLSLVSIRLSVLVHFIRKNIRVTSIKWCDVGTHVWRNNFILILSFWKAWFRASSNFQTIIVYWLIFMKLKSTAIEEGNRVRVPTLHLIMPRDHRTKKKINSKHSFLQHQIVLFHIKVHQPNKIGFVTREYSKLQTLGKNTTLLKCIRLVVWGPRIYTHECMKQIL